MWNDNLKRHQLLKNLSKHDNGVRVKEMAEILGMDKSKTTSVSSQLDIEGEIQIRNKSFYITDKGRAALSNRSYIKSYYSGFLTLLKVSVILIGLVITIYNLFSKAENKELRELKDRIEKLESEPNASQN